MISGIISRDSEDEDDAMLASRRSPRRRRACGKFCSCVIFRGRVALICASCVVDVSGRRPPRASVFAFDRRFGEFRRPSPRICRARSLAAALCVLMTLWDAATEGRTPYLLDCDDCLYKNDWKVANMLTTNTKSFCSAAPVVATLVRVRAVQEARDVFARDAAGRVGSTRLSRGVPRVQPRRPSARAHLCDVHAPAEFVDEPRNKCIDVAVFTASTRPHTRCGV